MMSALSESPPQVAAARFIVASVAHHNICSYATPFFASISIAELTSVAVYTLCSQSFFASACRTFCCSTVSPSTARTHDICFSNSAYFVTAYHTQVAKAQTATVASHKTLVNHIIDFEEVLQNLSILLQVFHI
jgi:hypothetical protein